jgi:nucleotide-binding universal stress UspA family protein
LCFYAFAKAGLETKRSTPSQNDSQHLTEDATEFHGGAEWHVDIGDPAERLLVTAAEEEARLIVVGSEGQRSPLLGSISVEVSRRAQCPVVVVPPGADQIRTAIRTGRATWTLTAA